MFVWRAKHKHLFSIRSCILFPSIPLNVLVCLHFSQYFIVPECFNLTPLYFQVTEGWPDPRCQWHRHQQSYTRGGGQGKSREYSRPHHQSIYPAQSSGPSPRDWIEKVSGTFETFLFDHIPQSLIVLTEPQKNVETFRPYQQQRIPNNCPCGRKHFCKFMSLSQNN